MNLVDQYREEIKEWRRICKIYEAALQDIKNRMGRVCEEFETCTHPACADSSGAFLVASQALEEAGWKFGVIGEADTDTDKDKEEY
jgi:hypothetical protein